MTAASSTSVTSPCSLPRPGERFVCSWSGGKDSCLAFHRAVSRGCVPSGLVTMCVENGLRTRSHGLPVEVIEAQAKSLDLPLVTVATSWSAYEARFVGALRDVADAGTRAAVFGDIDIPPHREWEEKVCHAAAMDAYLPLWQTPRQQLLDEFLALGFEARVIAVQADALDRSVLGQPVDRSLVADLLRRGVDACGENGEFHTVVTSGPLFQQPLRLTLGDAVLRSGYWFLDVRVDHSSMETVTTPEKTA